MIVSYRVFSYSRKNIIDSTEIRSKGQNLFLFFCYCYSFTKFKAWISREFSIPHWLGFLALLHKLNVQLVPGESLRKKLFSHKLNLIFPRIWNLTKSFISMSFHIFDYFCHFYNFISFSSILQQFFLSDFSQIFYRFKRSKVVSVFIDYFLVFCKLFHCLLSIFFDSKAISREFITFYSAFFGWFHCFDLHNHHWLALLLRVMLTS